jgi:hypothetical protein
MQRQYHMLGWVYVVACVTLVLNALLARSGAAPESAAFAGASVSEVEWFRRVKPYCNTVEIGTLERDMHPPATIAGAGYHAACFALAGRIDDARRVVDRLATGDRFKAAGVVFEVGHPVADAGDDRSAGPIMELVIDYWPNHYMALYHAGMAEYMLGQRDLARKNLLEFLKHYQERDGWTANARDVLTRLDTPSAEPMRRPQEPR